MRTPDSETGSYDDIYFYLRVYQKIPPVADSLIQRKPVVERSHLQYVL